jgi:hypothetical protein
VKAQKSPERLISPDSFFKVLVDCFPRATKTNSDGVFTKTPFGGE